MPGIVLNGITWGHSRGITPFWRLRNGIMN